MKLASRSRTSNSDPTSEKEAKTAEPQPAAIAFVTTEHFTLQGARASTISESVGRASMFLASLSGGLVALGLLATATHVGTAFYAFGLILLPTCAVLGLVTFQRTLQSGIEDYGYARRIARLRAYYFDTAPELVPYLASVGEPDRLRILGLPDGGWQRSVSSPARSASLRLLSQGPPLAWPLPLSRPDPCWPPLLSVDVWV